MTGFNLHCRQQLLAFHMDILSLCVFDINNIIFIVYSDKIILPTTSSMNKAIKYSLAAQNENKTKQISSSDIDTVRRNGHCGKCQNVKS